MTDTPPSGQTASGKRDFPRGAVAAFPEAAEVMPVSEVYFILAKTTGLIKIGYAKRADMRLSALQVGCPENLALIGIIETYLPKELERDLHARFAAHRVRGEWFACVDEIVDYCTEHARAAWV